MRKTILVTGANRGIGLAIVKEFARTTDDHILLGCRNLEEGQKLAQDMGDQITAVALDLSERSLLNSQIEDILKHHTIDVLINNAGVLHEGSFTDVSLDNVDASMRVNTIAPLELVRAVLPGMKSKKFGRIVNISSGWGSFDEGLSGPFVYSLSKAALNALTLCVAKDLPSFIKINSMCPGWVRTRMGGMMAARSPEEGAQTALWLSNLEDDGPSGGFFRDERLIEW